MNDGTSKIDTTVPHSARVWTYWLGGGDAYAVDREAGERVRELCPGIADLARVSREFLGRAVGYLAGQAGIRQFLDIGTGLPVPELPTIDTTHVVAQRIAPESRIVYIDNDPLVLAHAQALLTPATPRGSTACVEADVRDPEEVLAAAGRTLDLSRPVGLIMMGVLAHVPTSDQARSIVRRLVAGLSPGSFLAVRDGADTDADYVRALRYYNGTGATPYHLRTPDQIAGYLDGLEFVAPGVVPCPLWRPEPGGRPEHSVAMAVYGGVGRKPGA